MSLELAVQENTAALRDLIAALANGLSTSAAQVSAVINEAKPEPKAKVEAKPEKAKPEPKAKPEKDNADGAGEIVLQQVIDVTLALGKAGKRAELVELLGEFGVAKSSLLDPSDFASFHSKATALLEG